MPAAQTYLIAHTTAEERPAKMAMIGMMFGVGMIIGPAAGSAMVSAGILVPIVFSALIMLLPLPFVVNKLKGTPSQNRQSGPVEKLRFTDSKIRPYFILMITVYAIFFLRYSKQSPFLFKIYYHLMPYRRRSGLESPL